MKVLIDGFNPRGIYLGGLLALKGYKIAFATGDGDTETPRVTTLRMSLPEGWLRVENIKYTLPAPADILIIIPSELEPRKGLGEILASLEGRYTETATILLLDTLRPGEDSLHPSICCGQALWQAAMLQPDHVELYSPSPCLLIEKNKLLKKFFTPLKSLGLKLKSVDTIEPSYNSAFLYSLCYLPVALTGSTLTHFLSFSEGRKIISNLLRESFKIFEEHGRRTAPLPVMDPRKLANRIQKKTDDYLIHRYQPARQLNCLRQAFILGNKTDSTPNHLLNDMATEAGIEIFWNRRLVEFLERRTTTVAFKSPVELLKALE